MGNLTKSEREYEDALATMLDLAKRHIPAGMCEDTSFIKSTFLAMAENAMDKAIDEWRKTQC